MPCAAEVVDKILAALAHPETGVDSGCELDRGLLHVRQCKSVHPFEGLVCSRRFTPQSHPTVTSHTLTVTELTRARDSPRSCSVTPCHTLSGPVSHDSHYVAALASKEAAYHWILEPVAELAEGCGCHLQQTLKTVPIQNGILILGPGAHTLMLPLCVTDAAAVCH